MPSTSRTHAYRRGYRDALTWRLDDYTPEEVVTERGWDATVIAHDGADTCARAWRSPARGRAWAAARRSYDAGARAAIRERAALVQRGIRSSL